MKTEQEQIKAMTKDEIKKAFAICCGVQDCTGCPIFDMEKQNGLGCKFNLFTRVIDTVSEQEKEIERLKVKCEEQESEIDKLEGAVKENDERCFDCPQVKQAKIDVLNKLKDSYGLYYLSAFGVKERMLADILNPMIEELKK